MTHHRITDTDAAALLGGTAPADRPELADVATALSEFRGAAFRSLPQPSAELRERLENGALGGAVVSAPEERARMRAGDARRRAARKARLTVGASLALGLGLATLTVSTAGAVGILPGPAQVAFDHVVAVITNEPTPADDPQVTTVETPVDAPTNEEPAEQAPNPSSSPTAPEPVAPTPSVTPEPTPGASPSEEAGDGASEAEKAEKAEKAKKDKEKKDKEKKDKSGAIAPPLTIDGHAVDSVATGSGKPRGDGTAAGKS